MGNGPRGCRFFLKLILGSLQSSSQLSLHPSLDGNVAGPGVPLAWLIFSPNK